VRQQRFATGNWLTFRVHLLSPFFTPLAGSSITWFAPRSSTKRLSEAIVTPAGAANPETGTAVSNPPKVNGGGGTRPITTSESARVRRVAPVREFDMESSFECIVWFLLKGFEWDCPGVGPAAVSNRKDFRGLSKYREIAPARHSGPAHKIE